MQQWFLSYRIVIALYVLVKHQLAHREYYIM